MKNLEIQYRGEHSERWFSSVAMETDTVKGFKTLKQWRVWTKGLQGSPMRYRLVCTKPLQVIYTPR